DIVLHRDRHAVKRQLRGVPSRKALRLRKRILLVAKADEDRGIVVVADALIGARHRLRRRPGAGSVCCDDRGDGFGQAARRSLAGQAPSGATALALRKSRRDRSKRYAIVYILDAARSLEIDTRSQLLKPVVGK